LLEGLGYAVALPRETVEPPTAVLQPQDRSLRNVTIVTSRLRQNRYAGTRPHPEIEEIPPASEPTMKKSVVLTLATLILIAGLSAAPASAKSQCAMAFPILLGVGY
jgi:hypothetical protein